jgi:hypothetical protein
MHCHNCGSEINDGAAFCVSCGARVQTAQSPRQNMPAEHADSAIARDGNGNISWVYEYSLWKNPGVLLTVWLVMMIACLVPAILAFFFGLGDGFSEAASTALMVLGIGAGAVTALWHCLSDRGADVTAESTACCYRMDDEGVDHIQLKKQFRKAAGAWIRHNFAGDCGRRTPARPARGWRRPTRQRMHTRFSKVRTVKVRGKPPYDLSERVDEPQQIYAGGADFRLVRDFILSRVPKKRKVGNGQNLMRNDSEPACKQFCLYLKRPRTGRI